MCLKPPKKHVFSFPVTSSKTLCDVTALACEDGRNSVGFVPEISRCRSQQKPPFDRSVFD